MRNLWNKFCCWLGYHELVKKEISGNDDVTLWKYTCILCGESRKHLEWHDE